jgi:hypothetical protein
MSNIRFMSAIPLLLPDERRTADLPQMVRWTTANRVPPRPSEALHASVNRGTLAHFAGCAKG